MMSRELVAASSKPMVLTILARGESYGYEIMQKVRVLSHSKMDWTDGMLYPVLHRLEKAGFIKARWGKSESGRKRKYYRITAKGEQELRSELEQWAVAGATLASLQELLEGVSPCIS